MRTSPLEVRCRHCGGCALFHEPFKFSNARRFESAPEGAHLWGKVIVEELYPEYFPWEPPQIDQKAVSKFRQGALPGYEFNRLGMVECPRCGDISPSEISWPEDAYWQWQVMDETIVARNAEHAKLIAEFLSDSKRPITVKPSLRHIPSKILVGNRSDELIGQIFSDLKKAFA